MTPGKGLDAGSAAGLAAVREPVDTSRLARQISIVEGITSTGVHLIRALGLSKKPGPPHSLGATVYHDTQANYRQSAGKGVFTLSVGASNLFNRDPPRSQSATIGGYDASVYDIPGGRLGYIRIAYTTDP